MEKLLLQEPLSPEHGYEVLDNLEDKFVTDFFPAKLKDLFLLEDLAGVMLFLWEKGHNTVSTPLNLSGRNKGRKYL